MKITTTSGKTYDTRRSEGLLGGYSANYMWSAHVLAQKAQGSAMSLFALLAATGAPPFYLMPAMALGWTIIAGAISWDTSKKLQSTVDAEVGLAQLFGSGSISHEQLSAKVHAKHAGKTMPPSANAPKIKGLVGSHAKRMATFVLVTALSAALGYGAGAIGKRFWNLLADNNSSAPATSVH